MNGSGRRKKTTMTIAKTALEIAEGILRDDDGQMSIEHAARAGANRLLDAGQISSGEVAGVAAQVVAAIMASEAEAERRRLEALANRPAHVVAAAEAVAAAWKRVHAAKAVSDAAFAARRATAVRSVETNGYDMWGHLQHKEVFTFDASAHEAYVDAELAVYAAEAALPPLEAAYNDAVNGVGHSARIAAEKAAKEDAKRAEAEKAREARKLARVARAEAEWALLEKYQAILKELGLPKMEGWEQDDRRRRNDLPTAEEFRRQCADKIAARAAKDKQQATLDAINARIAARKAARK